MDEMVLRAMAKWPSVPAVFGWLALDRRGRWLLQGERIGNEAANRFIARNYAHDDEGRWYFQNGPQRVFVRLHYTPWVLSLDGAGRLLTHTGCAVARVRGAWVDEEMNLLLETEHGLGLVHDQDLAPLTEAFTDRAGRPLDDAAIESCLAALAAGGRSEAHLAWAAERVPIGFLRAAQAGRRFGFQPDPPDPGKAPEKAPTKTLVRAPPGESQ